MVARAPTSAQAPGGRETRKKRGVENSDRPAMCRRSRRGPQAGAERRRVFLYYPLAPFRRSPNLALFGSNSPNLYTHAYCWPLPDGRCRHFRSNQVQPTVVRGRPSRASTGRLFGKRRANRQQWLQNGPARGRLAHRGPLWPQIPLPTASIQPKGQGAIQPKRPASLVSSRSRPSEPR